MRTDLIRSTLIITTVIIAIAAITRMRAVCRGSNYFFKSGC